MMSNQEGRSNKKTVIVGDLHGRLSIVEKVLKTSYDVVFIGDYVDSFTVPVATQYNTLMTVLEAAQSDFVRVRALYGNHEESYTTPGMRCSGWNVAMQVHVDTNIELITNTLKDYVWVGNYFVSHAGVSQKLLDNEQLSFYQYLDRGDYYQIGSCRGGFFPVGGLFWCDWWKEFTPVPGINQIVGHTAYRYSGPGEHKGIITRQGEGSFNWNIDCQDHVHDVLIVHEDGITCDSVHVDDL